MKKISLSPLFLKAIFLILYLFFFNFSLQGADQCSDTDHSAQLSSSQKTYDNSDSVYYVNSNFWNRIRYYIEVMEAGTVTVTLTNSGNADAGFNASINSCPDYANNSSWSHTFATAGDFNLDVVAWTQGYFWQDYEISIVFVASNAAPTVSNDTFNIDEDASNGTTVDTVSASGSPTSFSILSGNNDGTFQINSAGVISIADNTNLDYETTSSYSLEVKATNALGSDTGSITININDINELIADYHFDECLWDGTSGEVKDSTNNYNSTAHDATTTVDALLGKSGDFRVADYIDLNSSSMNGLDSLSLSIWVRTSNIDSQQEIIQGWSSAGGNEFEVYLEESDNNKNKYGIQINIMDEGENFELKYKDYDVTDGNWHQLFITRSGEDVCLYIDGSEVDCEDKFNEGTLDINPDNLILGQGFVGLLDELKIFDNALSENEIHDIYNFENDGKNYNGTDREVFTCTPKPIADYRFDECSWDGISYDVNDSSGNNYNGIAIHGANTESNTIAGGGIGRVGNFNGNDDYIQQDKDNIYETLNTTASLSFWIKTEQPGDSTQWRAPGVIGMEESGGGDDIFWGWIDEKGKIGIDKGNTAGAKSDSPINDDNWHHVVLTRDSSSGETQVYVDGEFNSEVTSESGDVGNSFSSIGRIENSQDFNGYLDEVKIFDKVLSASEVSNIYADTTRNPVVCNLPTPIANYRFDAWDTFRDKNDGNINDRNISTKIVSQNFNLTIAALDENNTQFQDFNGTVCMQVVSKDDQNISGWNKLLFSDQNTSITNFKIDRAIGRTDYAKVKILWKKNVSSTCSIINEDNSTIASDFFAIRPAQFFITPTNATVKAGNDFNLSFIAGTSEVDPSSDYNETVGNSFEVTLNERSNDCSLGSFDPVIDNGFEFKDGNKTFNTLYKEVGIVDINISENNLACADRYARVDCDDQTVDGYWNTDDNLSITPNEANLTISLHHFNVDINSSNAVDESFTYLATDYKDFMHVIVDLNVTAQNKQNNTTKNYNDSCYANDVNLSFNYSSVDSNLTNFLYQIKHNNSILNEYKTNINTVVNYDLNKSTFSSDTNGSSILEILYNFQRDRLKPINPFDTNITDLKVSDSTDSTINGVGQDTTNTTFYYGRVKTKDISTNKQSIKDNLDIEVYSKDISPYVSDLHQNSLSWYVMKDNNSSTVTMLPKKDFTFDDIKTKITLNPSTLLVKNDFNITNDWEKSDSAYIHVKIPEYLWNSRYNDYNGTGDCSEHPCFKYNYTLDDDVVGIASGDFNGTSIGEKYNALKTKQGVKTFR